MNPAGMCCTTSTAASRSAGSAGITSARARGPPVDVAITTTCSAPATTSGGSGAAGEATPSPGRAIMRTPPRFICVAARSAARSWSPTIARSRLIGPDGLRTKSTAPSSSARSVTSNPGVVSAAESMTTGRGVSLMM